MKYRKKPVVIDAVQFTGENIDEIEAFVGKNLVGETYMESKVDYVTIRTREGIMLAYPGDWIIKGVHGEFYPCTPNIFEETYESMEEPDSIDTLDYYKNKLYIRDADESKSYLCNSLNAESCGCFRMAAACGKDGLYPVSKKQLETLGYYLERAQAVITYLREEVNRLEEEGHDESPL